LAEGKIEEKFRKLNGTVEDEIKTTGRVSESICQEMTSSLNEQNIAVCTQALMCASRMLLFIHMLLRPNCSGCEP